MTGVTRVLLDDASSRRKMSSRTWLRMPIFIQDHYYTTCLINGAGAEKKHACLQRRWLLPEGNDQLQIQDKITLAFQFLRKVKRRRLSGTIALWNADPPSVPRRHVRVSHELFTGQQSIRVVIGLVSNHAIVSQIA